MKKLMILMAAVATSVLAFGEEAADSLTRVFDATTAENLDGWSIPNGEGKAKLNKTEGVLTLATGGEAATWLARPDSKDPYMMGDGKNLYFDVSLNMLGQALDEVPTLPGGTKLALFLLDTTDMDGAPTGTNLYALAKHPTSNEKVLVKLGANLETLLQTDTATRLTVQTYKNVFKASVGEANSAFVVYQNGGQTAGTATSPVSLDCYYMFKEDGTVNWAQTSSVDGKYLNDGTLDPTVSGKKTCLLLSMEACVDGQSFWGLGFAGNAQIKKVEINDSGFDFIAPDVKTTTMTLYNVSVEVEPAEAYDAKTGALSADCTITVMPNSDFEVLTYTPTSGYLRQKQPSAWIFEYTYAAGNDVSFTAAAACAKVNDTAYATLSEALKALEENGGTLKLSRDIGISDTQMDSNADPLGFLMFKGTIVLDLAGKSICLPGDAADNHGVVYLQEGSLTITNSTADVGTIRPSGEGRPAVCCENGGEDDDGNPLATIMIAGGIIDGTIRDIVLEPEEEGGDTPEGAVPNIAITGGTFSVDPSTWVSEGYIATGSDGKWTVTKSDAPVGPTIDPITPSTSSTKVYESAAAATNAAEAINKDLEACIQAPEGVTDDGAKKAYAALFVAQVVDGTNVVVVLTDNAAADILKQVNTATTTINPAAVVAAESDTVSREITVTPGLYYSVKADSTLTGNLPVRSCELATGSKLSISLPKFTGAGFYQIQATVAPVTEMPVGE